MTSSFDSYVRLQAEDVPYVSFIRYRRYTQVNFWLMLPRVFPEILQGSLQYTLPSYHFPKVYSLYLLDCLSSFCTHFLRRHILNPWIRTMPMRSSSPDVLPPHKPRRFRNYLRFDKLTSMQPTFVPQSFGGGLCHLVLLVSKETLEDIALGTRVDSTNTSHSLA